MPAAVLFDLDGRIMNTDPIYFQVWQEVLQIHGVETDEYFYRNHISGCTNPQILKKLLPQLSLEIANKLVDYKEELFRQKVKKFSPKRVVRISFLDK